MAAVGTPICNFGCSAPPFRLRGVDGQWQTLQSARGPNGLLVMFICNHCPYVKAVLDKIIRDTHELSDYGIHSIAVMSNDPTEYPEDSFSNMQELAQTRKFPFPYVLDETQNVAKAYGAVCTPDFFGFNRDLRLQYRGRLDASGRNPLTDASRRDSPTDDASRELFRAMQLIAETGFGPQQQNPSVGCSIKWKTTH